MNSLDFLFYSLLPKQSDTSPRVLYGSSSQIASLTAIWLHFSITGIFMSFSICYRNKLADIYVSSPWPWMILAGIIYSSIILRYCFLISYKSLVAKRQKIKHIWIYYIINALILIGAPILSFVAFRLYLYGHV